MQKFQFRIRNYTVKPFKISYYKTMLRIIVINKVKKKRFFIVKKYVKIIYSFNES